MQVPFVIYGLVHPRTKRTRYIGKSRNLAARRGHKGRVGAWVERLRAQGLKPLKVVIEQCLAADWKERERFWIQKYRSQGCRLLNVCQGGNGSHTRGELSEQYRDLLGKVPDTHIAELAGLTRKAISYHRCALGISAASRQTRRPSPTRFQKGLTPFNKKDLGASIEALYGKLSDAEIADQVGLSRNSVAHRRKRRGIAACRGRRRGFGNVKITPDGVRDIRASYPKVSLKTLARRYFIHPVTAWQIATRRTWKHL